MNNGNDAIKRKITTLDMTHQLVEGLGLDIDHNGMVSASKTAFLLQKLITCIDESNSLNKTFSKLLTTESFDYEHEAECAVALTKVVTEHVEVTLNRMVVETKSPATSNSNALILELAKKKLSQRDNISEINLSSKDSDISNVTSISDFKKVRKNSSFH